MSETYGLQEYKDDNYDNSNIIIMDEIPEYDILDYDLYNAKELEKYYKDVEKSVRNSMEYKEYVQYLRKFMDMNKCAFFKNVTNIENTKIKIHLHHTPFTLFDITRTVYNKRAAHNESLEVELVAKEVTYIHYFLYVGLVPLAETAHELVHNQMLFIPLNIVLGKFTDFIEMYNSPTNGNFIPDDAMERYMTYCDLTKNYNEEANTSILKTIPIYLKLPGSDPNALGAYGLPKLTDLIGVVKNRLQELKNPQEVKGLIIDTTYDSNSFEGKDGMIKPFIILDEDLKAPNILV